MNVVHNGIISVGQACCDTLRLLIYLVVCQHVEPFPVIVDLSCDIFVL